MSNRSKWLLPGGIGLLVVGLVIVALVREPVQLDPATPEGTIQEYLQAISDEEYDRAFELLRPATFEGCVPSDVARYAPTDPFTANLDDQASEPGAGEDHAIVNVRIRFGADGMFGSGWESWESFELVSEDGFWWITGDPWPHFIWECEQRGDF